MRGDLNSRFPRQLLIFEVSRLCLLLADRDLVCRYALLPSVIEDKLDAKNWLRLFLTCLHAEIDLPFTTQTSAIFLHRCFLHCDAVCFGAVGAGYLNCDVANIEACFVIVTCTVIIVFIAHRRCSPVLQLKTRLRS
jgi:hypothetical protein